MNDSTALMKKDIKSSEKKVNRFRNLIPVVVILIIIVGIPMAFLHFQSKRSGMSWGSVIRRIMNRTGEKDKVSGLLSDKSKGEKITFLVPKPVGDTFTQPPLISNITASDLDQDGLLDVIVCDARSNTVSWIRQSSGKYIY